MFAISTGHYPEQPGFKFSDGRTEHGEVALWVERIATLVGSLCTVVPVGTTSSKSRWINDKGHKYAMEFHFSTDSKAELGPRVVYHPDSYESQAFAESLCRVLDKYDARAEPGFYRHRGSVDFFLNSVSATSVLVLPGHVLEADVLQTMRAEMCLDIAAFIDIVGKV